MVVASRLLGGLSAPGVLSGVIGSVAPVGALARALVGGVAFVGCLRYHGLQKEAQASASD
jgi:hypothetical protein